MVKKKDIVVRFLKEGRQLDASALDYFMANQEKIGEFLLVSQDIEQCPIITLGLVQMVLKEEPTVKIIKKFFISRENKKISISDYSNMLMKYYDAKKRLLMSRVDGTKLLSINKTQKQKAFVLICMVKEKDNIEKSADVEDPTGTTVVYFEDATDFENLLENDVVALSCESSAEGIKVKQIMWPDVPLKRSINKTKERIYCLFISDFHMDSKKFSEERYEKFVKRIENIDKEINYRTMYVFILGGISQRKEDVEKLFNTLPKNSFKIFLRSNKDATIENRSDLLVSSSPTMLEIEGIKFLLCLGAELYYYKKVWRGSGSDIMINVLKRRDLGFFREDEELFFPSKDSLMDQVPDIFVSGNFASPSTINYKGVTLLTTGSLEQNPVFWAADLKTREINKLDLS